MSLSLDDDLIPAGHAASLRDLVIGHLCTRLSALDRAALALSERVHQLGHPMPLPQDVVDLLGDTVTLCQQQTKKLDPYFCKANKLLTELRRDESHRNTFLDTFYRRLTFVGGSERPAAYCHLGWINDEVSRPVALSRKSGQVILVAGAQGSGKTVFSTVLCEGLLRKGEPLASSVDLPSSFTFFHVEEQDRLPQLLDGLRPNPNPADVKLLYDRLGVEPLPIKRLRLVVPRSQLPLIKDRLRPYEDLGLSVKPLLIPLAQLGQPGLEAALGADSGAQYVQRMLDDAQRQGAELRIEPWRAYIEESGLNSALRRAAQERLNVLAEIASPPGGPEMWDHFAPGLATVVYLGGPYMGHRNVLSLIAALLNGLMLPSKRHGAFQRTIVVDEMNLFDGDPNGRRAFTKVGRLVRHLGSRLVLMGQDLNHVEDELLGLAGLVVVFQLRNPKVFEYIRDRYSALRGHSAASVAQLRPGEALMAASETSSPEWQQGARRVRIRPLRCQHGGFTRTVA